MKVSEDTVRTVRIQNQRTQSLRMTSRTNLVVRIPNTSDTVLETPPVKTGGTETRRETRAKKWKKKAWTQVPTTVPKMRRD